MFITIINDCQDDNAKVRQQTRISSLFNREVNFTGIKNDLEASGNLIDVLDAGLGQAGIVLVNVAPRNGKARKWNNGTPFGYFYYEKTLVIASVDGYAFSLVKKLGLVKSINLIDLPKSVKQAVLYKLIKKRHANRIINTQFRSYEFLPLVAKWIWDEIDISIKSFSFDEVSDITNSVWWVDNFGNMKTIYLKSELDILKKEFGNLNFYEQLRDVPDNELAYVIGSSGIKDKRFIEIVKQGGSAHAEIEKEKYIT